MKGIIIPGALVLGRMSDSGDGNDLSDIDLTSATLDPRLTFQCVSQHAYYDSDGLIKFAAPNEWPLEYRDGIAIGRHEPEPQRTNVITDSLLTADVLPGSSSGAADWRSYRATANDFVTAPDGRQARVVTITADGVGSGIYQRASLLNAAFPISISAYCKTSSACSVYAERGTGGRIVFGAAAGWQRGTGVITGAESSYAGTLVAYSTADNKNGDTFALCGLQAEAGEFATSPIITTPGVAATRAAAFAFVPNPGLLATAARIYYTDGTTYDIEFSGAASGEIPPASLPWATRYIEGISYAKGFSR